MMLLLLAVGLSYILSNTLGKTHDLELTALFTIVFIIHRRFIPARKYSEHISTHHVIDSILFTFICMNVVLTTGGLQSPLFFLIYFLLFALGLMLEPVISITTALGIIAIFIPYMPQGSQLIDLTPLLALPFLVPFAVFLGSEYRKRDQDRIAYASLSQHQASTQQDALLFISTIVRGHIQSITQSVDSFQGDHELNEIRTTARRLQKLIDKFESAYQ